MEVIEKKYNPVKELIAKLEREAEAKLGPTKGLLILLD